MEFIHIADVHLGAAEFDGGATVKQAFLQVMERCINEKIDVLFVAGDLFHRPPSIQELKFVIHQFTRLAPTLVVIIAGNHDHIDAGSAWLKVRFPANVIFFGSEKLAMCELKRWRLRVYGSSYLQEQDTRPMPGSRVKTEDDWHNILLGHGGNGGHHPFRRDDLRKFTYVALGHLHQFEQLGPGICYPGSPAPVYPFEIWQHGYIRGSLNVNSGRLEIGFVALTEAAPRVEEAPRMEAAPNHMSPAQISTLQTAEAAGLEERYRKLCAELPIGRRETVLHWGLWALQQAGEEVVDVDL
ncbi:MAG: DNA repair exonuclease [Lachnospiraceae bacterium]|nr:DNA repair exonuclease [Lachnospiraceae bacterium]MDY5742055.1 DNA repair exonuclease [Lachnospiraceae bacterium]